MHSFAGTTEIGCNLRDATTDNKYRDALLSFGTSYFCTVTVEFLKHPSLPACVGYLKLTVLGFHRCSRSTLPSHLCATESS